MTKPFTEASNLPLSPLVALLAIGTMSPALAAKTSIQVVLSCIPLLNNDAGRVCCHAALQ